LADLKKFSDRIGEDVYDVISIRRCVERRSSYGGTSPSSVAVQIEKARSSVEDRMNFVTCESQVYEKCWSRLLG
jgi:argininosuccinate lyase